MSDPFQANGYIVFNFTSDKNTTEVICKLISKNPSSEGVYIFIVLLTVWTLAALITTFSLNNMLMVIIGWIVMFEAFIAGKKLNEGKLENHLFYITQQIK